MMSIFSAEYNSRRLLTSFILTENTELLYFDAIFYSRKRRGSCKLTFSSFKQCWIKECKTGKLFFVWIMLRHNKEEQLNCCIKQLSSCWYLVSDIFIRVSYTCYRYSRQHKEVLLTTSTRMTLTQADHWESGSTHPDHSSPTHTRETVMF